MIGPFDYYLFGLHIRSELYLPELPAVTLASAPQVEVRIGEVGSVGEDGLVPIDGGALLTIDGIARYSITDGSTIMIDRRPDVPDANVRLYLLGSALGMLLHQRGLLPLHANAVEIDGRAFAFAGASGAGKSTLAAWFHDHGYPIIADDVCAISFNEARLPFVAPGLPRLRLWREALERSGRDVAEYARSYAGDETWDKYDVPLRQQAPISTPVPLGGIYLLVKGDSLAITRLQGIEAIEAMFAHTYRGRYVPAFGDVGKHWQSCARLASHTPIFQLVRPWGLDRLAADIPVVVSHIRSATSDLAGQIS
ncbi:MAG: hypothetical protein ABIN83_07910 [Sphingomicrobium sp.]